MSPPEETLRTLLAKNVSHVVGLPDSTSGPLFGAVARHPNLRLVNVTREGEAFAIATGLWMGGAKPVVVVQNTGLLESGDSLRGTAQRARAPIPILVTGRGYAKMHAAGVTPDAPRTVELMTRPDVDTTALLTEPTLEAWGVPFERCEGDDDPAAALGRAIDAAHSLERPTAVVMARSLT